LVAGCRGLGAVQKAVRPGRGMLHECSIPLPECAPDDGWKYHPKHVEQFTGINKLCNVASCWIFFLEYTYDARTHINSKTISVLIFMWQ